MFNYPISQRDGDGGGGDAWLPRQHLPYQAMPIIRKPSFLL